MRAPDFPRGGCGAVVGGPSLRRLLLLALLTLLACGLAGCAFEETNEDGLAAFDRQEYGEALRIWLDLSKEGDTAAPYYIGRMCEAGLGMDQNYQRAAQWYRKAAERGNPYAQGSLAVLYAYGRGVPLDYGQSYLWSTLAAAGYSSFAEDERQAALKNRDLVAVRMTAAELYAAQRMLDQYRQGTVPLAPDR